MFKVGDVVVARKLSNYRGFNKFNGKRFVVTGIDSENIRIWPQEGEVATMWNAMDPHFSWLFGSFKFELDVFMTATVRVKSAAEKCESTENRDKIPTSD